MFGHKKYKPIEEIDLQKEVESTVKSGFRIIRTAISVFISILLTILIIGIIAGCVVVCAFAIYIANNIDTDVDSITLATTASGGNATRIFYYDSDGNLVEDETQRLSVSGNSYWASYEELPENLVNAFIAIEDKRFWDHNGFDLITTTKSVLRYFLPVGSNAGGSTITQQLIKNATGDDDYTIQRKVQEIFRAIALEQEIGDKTEIFEMYVNIIYLSQGCYGVQEAAHKYFNKDVSDLTLVECAAIAGITQSPTKWDPIQNPENNKYRRQVILTAMYDQGLITQAEYLEAYDQDLVIDTSETNVTTIGTTSWYTDAVISEAIDLLMDYYGVGYTYAANLLYSGGYSIVTAIDKDVQAILDKYYTDMSSSSLLPVSNVINVESSMIVLDPNTGNILGLVGGRGEKTESRIYNLATQATRQPGSSFKPVAVYAPAMEAGIIDYGSVYDDIPFNFGTITYSSTGTAVYSKPTGWPKNSNNAYRGLTTMEYAIAASKNTIAVHVLNDLGLSNSFKFLTEKLHITTLVDSDLAYAALGLGGLTYGVTLQELTTAYTIFSNNGVYTSSRTILEIRDSSDNVLIDNKPQQEVVISEGTSEMMTKLLEGVITSTSGTAHTNVTPLSRLVDVAGKTGTTNNNYDRWFIGYTPYYLAGIWIGFEEQQTLTGTITSQHTSMWNAIMVELHQAVLARVNAGEESLKTFDDELLIKATYCIDSGKLITSACQADPRGNRSAVGYFTKDTLPSEECDTHVLVKYCVGHGVAGSNCPDSGCTYVGLLKTERSFPFNIYVTDAQYTYRDLGNTAPYKNYNYPFYWSLYTVKGTYAGRTYSTSGQYNRYCSYHN
jgi:penicillin-binding protein 1A